MKDLAARIHALRTRVKIDGVFDERLSVAEFKRSSAVVVIDYSKV